MSGNRPRDARVRRIDRGGHENPRRCGLAIGAHRHERGFRQRRRAIVQRSIRYRHAGEPCHDGLILIEQLQRALTGLGLIRSVCAIELPTSRDGPDSGRDMMFISSRTDEVQRHAIACRALLH